MTILRRDESFNDLLKRARMDLYQFNTGVVRATDGDWRIAASSSTHEPEWGDCVHVQVYKEKDKFWNSMHLSPARARILALILVEAAARKERQNGLTGIDDSVLEKRR
jgi:hypothetical protein